MFTKAFAATMGVAAAFVAISAIVTTFGFVGACITVALEDKNRS